MTSAAAARLRLLEDELLPAARARAASAQIAYGATPNGMAELARQWELSAGGDREQLAAVLSGAVTAADQEYFERMSRGNQTDSDGLLRALLLPLKDDALTERLIAARIMGTFRQSDAAMRAGATRVRIHHLVLPGERSSIQITYPKVLLATNTEVTLTDVVAHVLADCKDSSRLRTLIGAAEYQNLADAARRS